jgi:polar amino acid transport system substrate-binding protein
MTNSRSITAAVLATTAAFLLVGCSTTAATPDDSDSPETTEAPLFSSLPQEIQDAGKIVFAGDSHPPYRTVEADNSVTGIDPDIQAALSKQLGVDIEIEIASGLPDILTGMLGGRYDAFNGPVKATPDRMKDFDAIWWMTTRSSYVFLESRADDIPDSSALCGLQIAGVTGSITETQVAALAAWCADEGEPVPTFVGLTDTNATILAVQSERVDALATTETGAIDIVDKTPDTFQYVTQTDEQGAGVDKLALLTPKGNGLGEVLTQAFQNLFDSGEYAEIMEKWHLSSVMIDAPELNPAV